MPKSVLVSRVLVLNSNWTPVSTASVRSAFVLLFRGAARVVCPETYEVLGLDAWLGRPAGARAIRAPRGPVAAPEVVVVTAWAGGRVRPDVTFTRRNLFRRDGYRCQYCGESVRNREKSIDHVLPRSRGGRTEWENCVLCCLPCNFRKGDRTPKEAGLSLIAKPACPAWSPLSDTDFQDVPAGWTAFLGAGREAG